MAIESANFTSIYSHAEIAVIFGTIAILAIIFILLICLSRASDQYNDLIKYYHSKSRAETKYYYYLQANNLKEIFSNNFSVLFDQEIICRNFSVLNKFISDKQFTKLQELKFQKLELLQELCLKFQEDNKDGSLSEYFENEQNNESFIILDYKDHKGVDRFIECRLEIVNQIDNNPIGLVIWFKDVTQNITYINKVKAELLQVQMENKTYSDILNNLPIPLWARDKNNKITYCNNEYKAIVNIDVERDNSEIPELDKISVSIAKMARMLKAINKEEKYIIAKNERKLYSISEIPVANDLLVGFALDQSEKESVSKELEQYSDAQNNLLETSSSAIAIYAADTKIKYFNQAFINLWKLDEKWLFTHPTYGEILEELRQKRILPEQANFLQFKKERIKLFTQLSETYNEFMYLPDGKSLRVIIIPFSLGGLLFAFEDMTSHLALERSLNSLNAVQRAMLNNLSEAIAVFGQDGRLKLYNPAYLKLMEMEDQFAASSPHISDILESKKYLFHTRDTDWVSTKNDLISALYEREFQRSILKMNNDRIIYRSAAPLPDGATLITYVNNSDLVKCESSLAEKTVVLNDFLLFQHQFLVNISKQTIELSTEIENEIGNNNSTHVGDLFKKLSYLQNEIVDLSQIYLSSVNEKFTVVDIKQLINQAIENNKEIKVQNMNFLFSEDYNASIIGNYGRIKQILNKILSYIIQFINGKAELSLEIANSRNALIINFNVIGDITDKKATEQGFLMLQSFLDIYHEKFNFSIGDDELKLDLELPQIEVNKILEKRINE